MCLTTMSTVFKLRKPSWGCNVRRSLSLLNRVFPMQVTLMVSLTRMVVVAVTKFPSLSYCLASNRRVLPIFLIFHIIWWRSVLHWRVAWVRFLSTCSISVWGIIEKYIHLRFSFRVYPHTISTTLLYPSYSLVMIICCSDSYLSYIPTCEVF